MRHFCVVHTNWQNFWTHVTVLGTGDQVRVYHGKYWLKVTVINHDVAPTSYQVEMSDGSRYRRNRIHLIEIPCPVKKKEESQEATVDQSKTADITEYTPILQTRYSTRY